VNCRFQVGDARNLQAIPDHSYDLVVSISGAMFAPKPFDVAKEMVRVTRPGGASSWETGFRMTPHSWRRFCESAPRTHRPLRDLSVP
jgi:ubiquinone/menaquinone biosynthesis C-methylase UbiE